MESKFWFYAYVTLGGAVLFAGGYYLGLSGKTDTSIEAQKIVSDQKKKESIYQNLLLIQVWGLNV